MRTGIPRIGEDPTRRERPTPSDRDQSMGRFRTATTAFDAAS